MIIIININSVIINVNSIVIINVISIVYIQKYRVGSDY